MFETTALNSHKMTAASKSNTACALMLANLLIMSIFGPIVVVNCTLYFLPTTFFAIEQEFVVMSLEELVSILVFVVCDIFLALALLAIRHLTFIYCGCSSKLAPLTVNSGSSLVPICLCFKWMLLGGKVLSVRNGFVYCVLLLILLFTLAIAQLTSLMHTEYSLLLTIFRYSYGKEGSSVEKRLGSQMELKQPLTAMMFIALKSCLVFWMLIDLFLIQPETISISSAWKLSTPMLLDYPLILSVLNFVFVFFAHRSIDVAYHVGETKCTALTQEYICCEGSLCSSAFHHGKLLAYDSIDAPLHSPVTKIVDMEQEVRNEYELPEWLRLQIFDNIYSNSF